VKLIQVARLLAGIALLLPTRLLAEPLNVYTYSSFASDWGPGPAIKRAFEAQCNCELNFVALDDGVSILNRVRLEGEYSQADILLGLDNNLMEEARRTGLLAEHGIDTSALTLPWSDPHFVPFDYGYFAFVYDSRRLSHPPASMHELVEGDAPLSIIYQDPRTSTPGLGLLLWIKKIYGNDAPQAWRKLAAKTVTVTKGWSEAYGMFLDGEADMVLSYTTSPAYHQLAENTPYYRAAAFEEGHYLQVEVAARLKTAPHPKLADQFMAFVLSAPFQDAIPQGNWMFPVKPHAPLPAAFNDLVQPVQSLEYPSEQVSAQRRDWINEWLRAVSR